MLVHSVASKYARFVVLVRLMYWTPPPPHQTIGPPPLLKSDDLFLGPPFKNPGHAPVEDDETEKLYHRLTEIVPGMAFSAVQSLFVNEMNNKL